MDKYENHKDRKYRELHERMHKVLRKKRRDKNKVRLIEGGNKI